MQYYRCKCGKTTGWTSMGLPRDCVYCKECNTTMATHPEGHREPQPHDLVTMYDEYTGEPYQRCANCYHVSREYGATK